MSLLRPHVVLLSLATLLGAHGCARPLPRGVQAADDVPTTRHVRRERTRSVAAQGFVQRFGPAPLVDDGRVYELGPWGYAVGVGVTNLGGAPVIVGGDWLVNSVAFPGGPSAWTGRRCGWTCALRPAVVPDVCSWRRGVLLGSGETVALFLDQRFEPEGTFRGVSVSYEVDTTSVPCTGGAWLRGDFLADTEPLL